jgi:hypothetical protein
MKKICLPALFIAFALSACSPSSTAPVDMSTITNSGRTNLNRKPKIMKTEQEVRASQWLGSFRLNDPEKEARLEAVIAAHLTAVREWHNEQLNKAVFEGTNYNSISQVPLKRQLADDAALPKSVHENLMAGLRKDLTGEQVEMILDKYTSSRVRINLAAYRAIVPDLTPEEDAALLALLQQAREEAVDYKSKEEIAAIFESYKTKCQQHLIAGGRDWNTLSNTYVKTLENQKAAAANEPAATVK